MLLSICVPTLGGHHRIEELVNQVRQIEEAHRVNMQLVIANNVTDDLQMSWLPFRREPFVVVVDQSTQVPFGVNLEATVKAASGDYLLLMGDDDVLSSDDLLYLLDLLSSQDPPYLVVRLAEDREDSSRVLPPRVLFMRSGSMMGLCFRKETACIQDFRNYIHRNPRCLYPQVLLAMKYAAKFGAAPLISEIQVLAGGSNAGVSRRFNDHMKRPTDFGIRERLAIADEVSRNFTLGKWRALSWKLTLLKWGKGIVSSLKKEGRDDIAVLYFDSIASVLQRRPILRLYWLKNSSTARRRAKKRSAS